MPAPLLMPPCASHSAAVRSSHSTPLLSGGQHWTSRHPAAGPPGRVLGEARRRLDHRAALRDASACVRSSPPGRCRRGCNARCRRRPGRLATGSADTRSRRSRSRPARRTRPRCGPRAPCRSRRGCSTRCPSRRDRSGRPAGCPSGRRRPTRCEPRRRRRAGSKPSSTSLLFGVLEADLRRAVVLRGDAADLDAADDDVVAGVRRGFWT